MEQHGRHEQTPTSHGNRRRQSTKKKPGIVWFTIRTILLVGILSGAMIGGIFMYYVKTTLAPTLQVNADDYTMNLSSFIYYQDKESGEWERLQTIYGNENRILVDYEVMPDALWQAAVAVEDMRFFSHHGVDWPRTIGATVNLFFRTSNAYGGSTITQQLLKNMTGDNDGTVNRKVREIFRALEFEKNYSKEEILELYLNTIFLGKNCYGVQTAAQYYFGKDVSRLTVAECASIIAITNNPSLYGPMSTVTITNEETGVKKTAREMNKDRQEIILRLMNEQGYLSDAGYEAAMKEELAFTDGSVSAEDLVAAAEGAKSGGTANRVNSYFVDRVILDVSSDLAREYGISEKESLAKLYNSGYNIYTTVDPHIQELAESVYEDRSNLDVTSSNGQMLQSGITIVEPSTGNVVAMVGAVGEKTINLGWNYATGYRQSGSAIKPLTVYAPALDAGAITMASAFDDYPVQLLNDSPWPKNSPSGYRGWTMLSDGVANSINTFAVQVVEKLGISNSFDFATEKLRLNLVADDLNIAALGLGGLTNGVSTMEMAAAYAVFANGGVYNSPRLYTHVTDSNGNTILENTQETHVAVKETTAYFMNQLLQGVMNYGTGGRYKLSGVASAGKTGTTSDNYDRYFAGYTPYYSAAVWCGYDQPTRISYSGNPAGVMWEKVMQLIADEQENRSFSKPGGLTSVTVCADSGLLMTDACAADLRGSRARTVEVVSGTAPVESCTLHALFDYCDAGQCLAGEFCPIEGVRQVGLLNYTREDYGDSITATDDAYLVSKLQEILECPLHNAMTVPPVVTDPNDPNYGGEDWDIPPGEEGGYFPEDPTLPPDGGGSSGGSSGEPVVPIEPAEPDGGGTDPDDFWNTVWDTGT